MSTALSDNAKAQLAQCPSPEGDYDRPLFSAGTESKVFSEATAMPTANSTDPAVAAVSPPATRSNSARPSPSTLPAQVSSIVPEKQQQQQKKLQGQSRGSKPQPTAESSVKRSASTSSSRRSANSQPGGDAHVKLKDSTGNANNSSKKAANNGGRSKDNQHHSQRKQSQADHKKNGNSSSGGSGSGNGSSGAKPKSAQSKQRRHHSSHSDQSHQTQTQQRQQPQHQNPPGKRNSRNKPAHRSSNATASDGSTPGRHDRAQGRSKRGSITGSDHHDDGEGSTSMDGHGDDTDESDEEYAIGFSQDEWDLEVRGRTALPTGLEQSFTAQILHTYETRLFPSAESIEIKRAFIEKFATILTLEFPDWEVDIHVFGSSVNGLGTSRSDVDICLTTEHKELENVFVLSKALRKYNMRTYCVPHARVPIVKAWDPELRTASDINVNNTIALHNTRMIQTFVAIDARVRPFVMAIKNWTKCREINDAAFGGTLSPYAWVNLAINFLQTRNPPILPVLHPPKPPMPSEDTKTSGEIDLSFNDDIESLRGFGMANTESIGYLLYAFFRTYAYEFDYRRQVVSLRNGCYLMKEQKGWDKGRPSRIFCVEEPFSTWLNLGHSANTTSVEGIRQEFQRAFRLLRDGGSYDEVCDVYQRPQRSAHPSNVRQSSGGSARSASTAPTTPAERTKHSSGTTRNKPVGIPGSHAGSISMDRSVSSSAIGADRTQPSNSYSAGYRQSPYGIYHNTAAMPSPLQFPFNMQRRESDDVITLGLIARQQQQEQQQQQQALPQYWYSTQNQLYSQQQRQTMLLNSLNGRQAPAAYSVHAPQQNTADLSSQMARMAIGLPAEAAGSARHGRTPSMERISTYHVGSVLAHAGATAGSSADSSAKRP